MVVLGLKMLNLMDWRECREKFIKRVEVDQERIKSIVRIALLRLERARNIKVKSVSLIVEDYYEVIKELLTAYLLKNGLRSRNHQCLITYFYRENLDYESEAHIISQMSFFRNRLDYYGEEIPEEFYKKNKEDFEKIIKILINLIEK